MSKSLDNYIGIDEKPEIMYEKAMKIPDECLLQYYQLTTDMDLEEVKTLIKEDILLAHRKYAREIIKMYHGEEYVKDAENRYDTVAKGGIPEDIKEIFLKEKEINICDLLVKVEFATSKSEAKRLIMGNGVKIDNKNVKDIHLMINIEEEKILRVGKSKFIKVRICK